MLCECFEHEMFTLSDLLHKRRQGDEYFQQFGFDKIYTDGFPILTAMWDRIVMRCNERYYDRYVGGETLEQWQRRLQAFSDTLFPRYERAFAIYESKALEIANDIIEKELTSRNYSVTNSGKDTVASSGADTSASSGTDSSDGQTRNIDTPDSAVNADDNYADNVSKSTTSTTYGKTDTLNYGRTDTTSYGHIQNIADAITRTKTGKNGILEAINANISQWRDLESDLVREYSKQFLNYVWY